MAQTINVEGVGPLQFPDGMSDQEMAAAIHKNFPELGQPQAMPPKADSAVKAGVKTGLLAQPAVAGALAGMAAGQVAIPVPFVGAILGGIVGGYLGDKATQTVLKAMPETAKKLGIDPETLERNEKAYPLQQHLIELATQAEGFKVGNPLKLVGSLEKLSKEAAEELTRNRTHAAANAAIGAVLDIGQQKLANPDGDIDWKRAGEQALMGTVLQGPTKLGEKVMGVGERAVPWRTPKENLPPPPDTKPPPASSPSSGETTAAVSAGAADPNRQKVMDHVASDERSIPTSIAKATGIKTSEVQGHLKALKDEGKIIKKDNEWIAKPVEQGVSAESLLAEPHPVLPLGAPVPEDAFKPINNNAPISGNNYRNKALDDLRARNRAAIRNPVLPPDSTPMPEPVRLPFEGDQNAPGSGIPAAAAVPDVNAGGTPASIRLPMEHGIPPVADTPVADSGRVAGPALHPERPNGPEAAGSRPLVTETSDTRPVTPPLRAQDVRAMRQLEPGERLAKPPLPEQPKAPKPPALQTETGAPSVTPDRYNFTPSAVRAITERGNLGEALHHLASEAGGTPKRGEEPSPLRDLSKALLNATEDKPLTERKTGEHKVDEKLIEQERARLTQEALATRAPEPPKVIVENFRDTYETQHGDHPPIEEEAKFIARWKNGWAEKNPRGLTESEKAAIETKLGLMRMDPKLSQKYETQRIVPLPENWINEAGEYRAPREPILDEHGNTTGEYKTPDPTQIPKSAFNGATVHVEGVDNDPASQKRFDRMKGKEENGVALGQYSPRSNSFHFLRAGLNDRTILHEGVHAVTVRVLRDYLVNGGKNLDAVQRQAAEHVTKIFGTAREQLRGKWRAAFKNEYEFVAWGLTHEGFQRDLAKIRDPRLQKYTGVQTIMGKVHNLLEQFANSVARMLKIKPGDRAGNALLELINASGDLISQPEKGTTGVPSLSEKKVRAAKKAEPHISQTAEQIEANRVKFEEMNPKKPSVFRKLYNAVTSHGGREDIISDLQNKDRYLDQWAKYLNMGKKHYTTLAQIRNGAESLSDVAAMKSEHLIRDLQSAIGDYAKATKLDGKELLSRLHTLAIGKHEGERRHTLAVETKPLSTKKEFMINGKLISAADWRDEIMRKLHSGEDLSKNDLDKKLYQKLEWLAEHRADADGYSPRPGTKAIDEHHAQFNVAGPHDRAELASMRELLAREEAAHPEQVKRLFEAKKALDEHNKELDKESGAWSQPLENIVRSRGWENYMSFRGEHDTAAYGDQDIVERMRRDLTRFVDPMQGRHTESENPFTQSVIEAGRAAGRVGRNGITAEIKRLAEAGHPEFKKEGETIKFEDRYTKGISEADLKGKNIIFHTLPNGDVERYRIKDEKLAAAIKGTFHDVHPIFQGLNAITGMIGRQHTRYNIAFAPYNFVRHAMTSSMMVGVEQGKGTMGNMLYNIAATVSKTLVGGGFFKAGRLARMYENNDLAGIKKLADSGDAIAQHTYEYITNGGFVKWQRGLGGHDAVIKDLKNEIGPSMVVKTVEQFQKIADIWNDTFEFAGRIAAYGPVKDNIIAKMKAQGIDTSSPEMQARACKEAAIYTKDLFNYSKVGTYGKEAGSMFMFLRPAMTTAVRSMDAISPAFQKAESLIPYLPKSVQADPEAIKNFTEAHNKQRVAARHMMAGMFGAGLTMYAMSYLTAEKDDQGRNKVGTDDMALWGRNIRIPLHGLGGKDNDYLQIPWGFGLGAFGALGAQIASVAMGHNTLGKALANMIPTAMDSYLPLPVAKFNPMDHPFAWLGLSAAPTFARPALEYAMNVDEFGKEIYNNRMNQFGDPYQGGDALPEAYGMATRMLMDAPGGRAMIDPGTLHFFANSYADGWSRIAHNATGIGLLAAGQKDFDPKRDLVVLDSFLGKSSSYDARELADVEKQVKRQDEILKVYKAPGREDQLDNYLDKNPNAEMAVRIYNQNLGRLNAIRNEIKLMGQRSDLSPKERHEELVELRKNRDWAARDLIDSVSDYLD